MTLSTWLTQGVVQGTLACAMAWLASATLLKSAHPAGRATAWSLALLRFVLPFTPTFFVPAPTMLAPLVAPQTSGAGAVSSTGTPSYVMPVLLSLWAVGVVAIAVVRLTRAVRQLRTLRALPRASGAVQHRITELAARMGVTPPETFSSDRQGPFVAGVLRPVLVVPSSASGATLDAMVLHELAHLPRRDPLVRALQLLVETLFFFWPPVRWAGRQLDLTREQACDLSVLDAALVPAADYAHVLLSLGSPNNALAMASRRTHLEQRISLVLTPPRAGRRLAVIGTLALFTVGLAGVSLAASSTSLTASPLKVDDHLDARALHTLVVTRLSEFNACLAAHPATGALVLHWTVKDDGSVGDVCQSDGTTTPQEFGRCVSDVLSKWSFQSPGWSQQANVEYRFDVTGAAAAK